MRALLVLTSSLLCLAACPSKKGPAPVIGGRPPPTAAEPSRTAAVIAALPDPASSPWDQKVKLEMLRAYDTDRSGKIQRQAELRAVPCDVWHALDRAVSGSEEYKGDGVAVIYGFTADKLWVGYAFGIAGRLRPVAADAVRGCGIELTGPANYDPTIDYDSLTDEEDEEDEEGGGD